ncbi:hypothetical protein LAW64_05570 [Escherichia coli]|nr:hypothetical protein [Escherichia coli]
MADNYLQIRKLVFRGPNKESVLPFFEGVNSICGASDTGKSFVAESIDFMLGGTKLREIVELSDYTEIELYLVSSTGKRWCLHRAVAGGNFTLTDLDDPNRKELSLKQKHAQGKADNLSGFLLEQLGLLNKKILKSRDKSTTRGFSFRDLARLALIQEDEIQRKGSPFLSGNPTNKTSELAALKLLLTGVDDSSIKVVSDANTDNSAQIALIDEFLSELVGEIKDLGIDRDEILSQLSRLELSIVTQRESLTSIQQKLNDLLLQRGAAFEARSKIQKRIEEISELVARFDLLHKHYVVDIERLKSIQESGLIFIHIEAVPCPHCGASPDHQNLEKICDGDVDSIINSATAEIVKIERLLGELDCTVSDLRNEEEHLEKEYLEYEKNYQQLDNTIRDIVSPEVDNYKDSYIELVDKKSEVQKLVDLFTRRDRLEDRKATLIGNHCVKNGKSGPIIGPSDSVIHGLSLKISSILKAWHFPGECHVFFDKVVSDFVIDGKPRGSRGKGLRAITHAAVSVALLELCQEEKLSHPGLLVLDSPLLAYYKPEGEDDVALQGTDLKEKFYDYLVRHHSTNSQIIVIENPHPPESLSEIISTTIFTNNPKVGRLGLL